MMKMRTLILTLFLGCLLVGSCSSHTPEAIQEEPETPVVPETPSDDDKDDTNTPEQVLFKSFSGRVMCGYQGWFTAEGDNVGKGWQHLYPDGSSKFEPGYCHIEFWPDMGEYTKKYPTLFKNPDGTTAYFFSSADYETADLHFKWMKQYGIDGAIIQRFKSTIQGRPWMDDVLENCIKAAEKYGVAIMLEYDLSGLAKGDDLSLIINDWKRLNDKFHFTDPDKCPNYLWEKGYPLVGFYGVGLKKGDSVAEQYLEMMDNMVGRNGEKGRLSFMAGTGYYWLSSGSDAKPFNEWEEVYKRCAVISPWAVGRYSTVSAFDAKQENIAQDARWCKKNDVVYAPVAFPGFSWRNAKTSFSDNGTKIIIQSDAPYDQVPRLKGEFLWRQLGTYKELGADAVFVAMFDEIDEGTAIFKCSHKDMTPSNISVLNPQGRFLNYDDDLDSGYYMFLVGEAGKWFKGTKGYYKDRLPGFKAPVPLSVK